MAMSQTPALLVSVFVLTAGGTLLAATTDIEPADIFGVGGSVFAAWLGRLIQNTYKRWMSLSEKAEALMVAQIAELKAVAVDREKQIQHRCDERDHWQRTETLLLKQNPQYYSRVNG